VSEPRSRPDPNTLRDYLRRSRGESSDEAAWLLESALARASGEGESVDFFLEASMRMDGHGARRGRYLLCWPSTVVGMRAFTRVEEVLAASGIPPLARAWLDALRRAAHLPNAVIVGSAWSREPSLRTVRLYLEQRSLAAVLDAERSHDAAACSLEWPIADVTRVRRRDYLERAVPRDPSREWLETTLGRAIDAELAAAVAELSAVVEPRYAYVQIEEGARERPLALQLVHAPTSFSDARVATVRLARALGIDPAPIAALHSDVPEGMLRVTAFGVDPRVGPHLTLYHAAAQEGVAVAARAPSSRAPIGAVAIEIAGARSGVLSFVPEHLATQRPFASAPGVVLHAERGLEVPIELARQLLEELAPIEPSLALCVARAETRLAERLARAGLRIVRWTVEAAG
jgi:hypothetical protein